MFSNFWFTVWSIVIGILITVLIAGRFLFQYANQPTRTRNTQATSPTPPPAVKKSKYGSVTSSDFHKPPQQTSSSSAASSTSTASPDTPELDPAEQAEYEAARSQTRLEYTLIKCYQLMAENIRCGRIRFDNKAGLNFRWSNPSVIQRLLGTNIKDNDTEDANGKATGESSFEALRRSELQQVASKYPHYNAFDTDLPSVRSFQHILLNTHCIFAKKSKVWGSPPVNPQMTVQEQALAAVPGFIEFTLKIKENYPVMKPLSEEESKSLNLDLNDANSFFNADTKQLLLWPSKLSEYNLDAFMIEIQGESNSDTVPHFASTIRKVLSTVSQCDPIMPATNLEGGISGMDVRSSQCMAGVGSSRADEVFGSARWHFTFLGETFFVTCFAPCYPSTNARCMFLDIPHVNDDADFNKKCYVLFQPELSFLRRNLSPDTKETNWNHPKTERDRIRVAFKEAGRPYFIPNTIAYPTAHYIVPEKDAFQGKIVKWWQRQPGEDEVEESAK